MGQLELFTGYLAEGFGCARVERLTDRHVRHLDELRDDWHRDDVRLDDTMIVVDHDASVPIDPLLGAARSLLAAAPVVLLVVRYREARRGAIPVGPSELTARLAQHGIDALVGRGPAGESDEPGDVVLAVLERSMLTHSPRTPLQVVAFMPVYNERDIIASSLRYLHANGVHTYVIDNWSTDGTFEEALGSRDGVIGVERFPAEGPVDTYQWRRILRRVETLAEEIPADWFMLHDADERRSGPWRQPGLADALARVDGSGFTCVDHVVLTFSPAGERFDPAVDVEHQLHHFAFSAHEGHFHQRKAWKNVHLPISLADSAGHDVRFPGRLVHPFKFLLKHYPVRSTEQGARKIFRERTTRWDPGERALGWHRQYDGIRAGAPLVRDRSTLERFDDARFAGDHLIARLSGIGVFAEAPPWATGPRQSFEAELHESH